MVEYSDRLFNCVHMKRDQSIMQAVNQKSLAKRIGAKGESSRRIFAPANGRPRGSVH